MRLHVINLPHTQTTKDYCWCAYTSKVLRFCNMMSGLGHEVFLYGGTENDAKVSEFITVVTEDQRKKWFGNYDCNSAVFDNWDPNSECWVSMNAAAALEVAKRKQPGDFLCLIAGSCQWRIHSRLPDLCCVEWGIGYEGIIRDTFHVFESNAWMHYVYGMHHIKDGAFFDTVIPNSFDDEDYIYKDSKEDYLLYIGRPTMKKGLEIISNLAARGHTVITAGQGSLDIPGVKHMGVVRGKEKAELIANAKAVLSPTLYIEPFGGIVVEALLSGTPVITTDFGAFTETVRHGIDGYRCHTMGEFERATEYVQKLEPKEIRKHAERYLTRNVCYDYDEYFRRLQLLDGDGWYHI